MAWPYLHEVRIVIHLLEGSEHRIRALFGCAFHFGRFFEQVGTADVANEDEVTCEDAHRFITAATTVDQHERDAFRCMAWGVDHFQFDIADIDDVAVFQVDGIFWHIFIFPVLIAFVGHISCGVEAL